MIIKPHHLAEAHRLIIILLIISPVLVPPVMIHAPVVLAACSKPWWQTRRSFGWRSKFAMPPWTEMTSLGSSSDHCCCSRCIMRSGRVSHDSRMYWHNTITSPSRITSDRSNLVIGEIASFLFARWQLQFVIAMLWCWGSTPNLPFPLWASNY